MPFAIDMPHLRRSQVFCETSSYRECRVLPLFRSISPAAGRRIFFSPRFIVSIYVGKCWTDFFRPALFSCLHSSSLAGRIWHCLTFLSVFFTCLIYLYKHNLSPFMPPRSAAAQRVSFIFLPDRKRNLMYPKFVDATFHP